MKIKKNNLNFWNADNRIPGTTIKSVYDPCPRYYHVPEIGVFKSIQYDNNYKNSPLQCGPLINGSSGLLIDVFILTHKKHRTGNYWSNNISETFGIERAIGLSVGNEKYYTILNQEKGNGFYIRPQYDVRS